MAVVAVAVAPVLAAAPAAAATTVIGSGSSAEQPVLTSLFAAYKKVAPKVHFVYTADGGNAGVVDVQQKRSQFAINTRAPLPSDGGTAQYKLFLDGLCVAVNRSNPLSNLSIAQTADAFLGVFTNWGQVPGSHLTTTIDPIGRQSSAGSYTFFQKAVLGGKTQASNVEQLSSDGLVATAIKHDRTAIGYVGLAHSGARSGIKAVKLNGIGCKAANIKRLKYPMSRYIWGVLSSHHTSKAAAAFLGWVRTSAAAGRIIAKVGAVPAFNR